MVHLAYKEKVEKFALVFNPLQVVTYLVFKKMHINFVLFEQKMSYIK